MMVNDEKIGIYQDSGEKNWWNLNELPKNVTIVSTLEDLLDNDFKSCLIITDRVIKNDTLLKKSVIYRPKSLIIGIGLHWDTTKDTIEKGIFTALEENDLSFKSVKFIASMDKGKRVKGLDVYCKEKNIDILLFSKERLMKLKFLIHQTLLENMKVHIAYPKHHLYWLQMVF